MYLFDEIGIMANMDKKFKIQHKDKIIPNGELKGALKGKGGLIFCKSCNSVYYKKSWHHNLRYYKNLREDLAVSFMLCPACKMIESKKFEGQIVINDLPKNLHENAINLIEAFCHRARQKDPMDRLIDVKKTNGGIKIPRHQIIMSQHFFRIDFMCKTQNFFQILDGFSIIRLCLSDG